MTAGRSRRLVRCAASSLAILLASSASAFDWRDPWQEPHDATTAAKRSDEYAWRLFVALEWPGDPRTRGPDRSARFGSDLPVVWETWRTAESVYLERGADPGPWLSSRLDNERRFETFLPQDLPNLRHVVAGVMVPLSDPIASSRRLTEIRMNRPTYEFIRSHRLYSVEGQLGAYAGAGAVAFPYGAREVKAKWRPIREDERARYHTLEVRLADGTQRLYGLTGLHIASKDLPSWFWATFEHVDNPTLADSEGWELPSRDRFACGSASAGCNRAPAGIGLEGTVWQYYRLRGTLTGYTDAEGEPARLANSEFESGMQTSASCITCHARAAIAVVHGESMRLPILDQRESATDPRERRGFLGAPKLSWFEPEGAAGPRFKPLDFVWSLSKARRVDGGSDRAHRGGSNDARDGAVGAGG